MRAQAEARYFATTRDAEAKFQAAMQEAKAVGRQAEEAEALTAMAGAYSDLSLAFGGLQGHVQYLMIEKRVYGEVAHANAAAVQGMAPKMTTGFSGEHDGDARNGAGVDAAAVVRNTYQLLPPLM